MTKYIWYSFSSYRKHIHDTCCLKPLVVTTLRVCPILSVIVIPGRSSSRSGCKNAGWPDSADVSYLASLSLPSPIYTELSWYMVTQEVYDSVLYLVTFVRVGCIVEIFPIRKNPFFVQLFYGFVGRYINRIIVCLEQTYVLVYT